MFMVPPRVLRSSAAALAALLALGLSTAASAQALYVASAPAPGVAPTYTGWTPIAFTDRNGAADPDDGIATVALPFSFSLFGRPYTSVDVSANGNLIFEVGTPKTCPGGYVSACSVPRPYPTAGAPNGIVGFWWGDMDLTLGSGSYTVTGVSPDRVFAIRFTNWGAYDWFGPNSMRSVQVELFETSNKIRIYYGSIALDPDDLDEATVGAENFDGTEGVNALSCNTTTLRCGHGHWPAGSFIEISPAIEPELLPVEVKGSVLRPKTVNGNPGFELDVTTTIRNRGLSTATGFTYALYLSSNTTFDGNDLLLATHPNLLTLAGGAQGSYVDQNVAFERPQGTGNFYLLAVVDPPSTGKPFGEIAEAIETNNVLASAPYVLGAELNGTVSTVPATGPNELTDVTVKLRNAGIDPAGPFDFELWLSSDTTLGTGDTKFHTGTVTLQAGETLDQVLNVRFPNVQNGDYFVLLNIDPPSTAEPRGKVLEANENDNLAVSGKLTIAAADLIVEEVRLREPLAPYNPTSDAYFGEPARVTF
ncbi:MAG: CARDB domain-containing protein, partial [Myxococcales bacterium]